MTPERRQQLLIVEDDLDLAEMLKAYFNVQGFDVLTAAWGEEAVKLAHDQVPSLVVLDIRLPDIDGFEVCRRLRTKHKTQAIPIIFLTEKRDRVDKLQGLEMGVVDYITKPFDIQELRLRVRNALYRAAAKSIENPVTGLPEGEALDERLTRLLKEPPPDWVTLVVVLHGLDAFRDLYGFIASDDVLRAISLMVANAVSETGGEGGFIGHLDQHDFLLVTDREHAQRLRDRIMERIGQSLEYFYPRDNRGPKAKPGERLGLSLGELAPAEGPFENAEALKEAAHKVRKKLPG
jgi:PleD family two-component response regulator